MTDVVLLVVAGVAVVAGIAIALLAILHRDT